MSNRMLNADEVAEWSGKSRTWAYNLIRQLNEELENDGYIIARGRIPETYLYKRMGFNLKEA